MSDRALAWLIVLGAQAIVFLTVLALWLAAGSRGGRFALTGETETPS